MKFAFLSRIILLASCCPALTQAENTLLFSHSSHPVTHKLLIPLLQEVYQDLGYKLALQEAEGARAVKLLNTNVVDGDIGRLEPIMASLDKAIAVTQLDTIKVVLYCRQELACNDAVLQNPKLRVLVPTVDATLTLLTNQISAKRYFNNDWDGIIEMFAAGKIDYLLWVESRLIPGLQLNNANKASTTIGPFRLYHILHNKHQPLAEAVSAKLSQKLAELDTTPQAKQ